MDTNNSDITTLHNLLDYDASRFTSAEAQLKPVLVEWINDAGSLKLKAVMQKYLDFVLQHIVKFESFFETENIQSISLQNRVMFALIEDSKEKIGICNEPATKDACILACIQRVNHFKISMYGTAASFANTLGMGKAAEIFHEAEVNEKQIDDRLSQLAEHEINLMARSTVVLEE